MPCTLRLYASPSWAVAISSRDTSTGGSEDLLASGEVEVVGSFEALVVDGPVRVILGGGQDGPVGESKVDQRVIVGEDMLDPFRLLSASLGIGSEHLVADRDLVDGLLGAVGHQDQGRARERACPWQRSRRRRRRILRQHHRRQSAVGSSVQTVAARQLRSGRCQTCRVTRVQLTVGANCCGCN